MSDPISDPRPGDKVRGVWRRPSIHTGGQATITVVDTLPNLIAVTSTAGRPRDVHWIRREDWCRSDSWTARFEVIYAVER